MRGTLGAVRRTVSIAVLSSLVLPLLAYAQQTQPRGSTYAIPTDVQAVGGGESGKSNNYLLDDTIGEGNIGPGRSTTYDLNAGYRQTTQEYLSLTCSAIADLESITGGGQRTGSGTCVVITDAQAGYALSWQVRSGSGGTFTGHLISEQEAVIQAYTPLVAGTPETWSVSPADARWGGRLRSSSTDTDAKWGTDGVSDQWLNVGTGSYTVVSRNARTDTDGSDEILQFRAEIGASRNQPAGAYQTTVTVTASSL